MPSSLLPAVSLSRVRRLLIALPLLANLAATPVAEAQDAAGPRAGGPRPNRVGVSDRVPPNDSAWQTGAAPQEPFAMTACSVRDLFIGLLATGSAVALATMVVALSNPLGMSQGKVNLRRVQRSTLYVGLALTTVYVAARLRRLCEPTRPPPPRPPGIPR